MNRRDNGPTDPLTPCDKCGGGTYTFPSGSVWCPNEGCTPGGHFVKRVAFERAPTKQDARPAQVIRSRRPNPVAASESARRIAERLSDKEAARLLKKDEVFATGMDDFIGGER